MKKLNRIIMWLALIAIGLLADLSIIGAFYGPWKAKLLFNSIPLVLYWCVLAVILVAGFLTFDRLLNRPGLFMVHAGCLLVLVGGIWGSQAGHKLAEHLFGIQKIPNGYMLIRERESQKYVMTEDFNQQAGELPFSIRLKDFRVEYYPDKGEEPVPQLHIKTPQDRHLQLMAEPGKEISLGKNNGKLKVLRTFRNFKISIKDGKRIITDEGKVSENPAVELEIETADGNSYIRYVFEHFEDFNHKKDNLQLRYISQKPRMIRDYFSDVVIIKNGKEVGTKTIEVNHPLHYGGYHFYQHSYDSQAHKYTILSVTSDSGLYTVYGGYWLMGLGVFWQFWLRHIVNYIKDKKNK